MSTIPYLPKDGLALQFVDTKDMQKIGISDFQRLVRKAELPEYPVMNTLKETVEKTLTLWNEEKAHYDLPSDIQDRIYDHMTKTTLAKSE